MLLCTASLKPEPETSANKCGHLPHDSSVRKDDAGSPALLKSEPTIQFCQA
jgi:hypothetical protein